MPGARQSAAACAAAALAAAALAAADPAAAGAAGLETASATGELVTVVDGPTKDARVRVASGEFVPVAGAARDAEPGSTVKVTVNRRAIERPDASKQHSSFTPHAEPRPALDTGVVVAPPSSAGPGGPAAHQVTVAIAVPRGVSAAPNSADAVRSQLASVSTYWSEQSGGKVTFAAANVTAPLTLDTACSDYWGMWREAASRTGFVPGPDKHLVLSLPRGAGAAGCSYGLASIGSGVNAGGYAYVTDTAWPVLAHELGHNLGLSHAERLLCTGGSDVALTDLASKGCTIKDYGDPWDVMAASAPNNAGSLSSPQAIRLGLMPLAAVTQVTAGTVNATLAPISGLVGVRALRVVDPATGVPYFVEYRTRTGRDYLLYTNMTAGVRILREDTTGTATARPSLALDATPTGAQADYAWSLPVGSSFTSYGGGVSVKVLSQSAAGAQVSVTAGAGSAASAASSGALVDLTAASGRASRVGAGGWYPVGSANGYAFGTALVTYTSGATWSVTVEGGRRFDLLGTAFPAGAKGRILIDGAPAADFDTYRAASATPYQQVLSTVSIPAGRHTVSVVALPSGARSTLALDAYRLR